MKEILQILSTLTALFLGGCATQQLSVEKHGGKFAPRLSVKESEIQFLSYGDFIAQFENLDQRIVAERGIIALTESDLRLETRHIRYLFSKELTAIPFHELEGVSKIASQIHIKHDGKEIVLEFNRPSSPYYNANDPETVFQLLTSRGIPVYEVAELTEFPRYTRRPGVGSRYWFADFYPSYIDDSMWDDWSHTY